MKRTNIILNFLKGFLMGLCDVIPGISGGTIAFITGIYERLIKAVHSLTSKEAFSLLNVLVRPKRYNEVLPLLKKLDVFFLLNVGAGILVAIFSVSYIVKYLLDNYFVYTMSFFVGLILASSGLIYNKVPEKKSVAFILPGLAIGVGLLFIIPMDPEITYLYIFLSGLIAISAMFLPGISGAYLLTILGSYRFILEVIHDLAARFGYFLAFAFGAAFGALAISRVITFLLDRWHDKTLFVLLGVVIGSLVIPLNDIFTGYSFSLLFMLVFVILGILPVLIIQKLFR